MASKRGKDSFHKKARKICFLKSFFFLFQKILPFRQSNSSVILLKRFLKLFLIEHDLLSAMGYGVLGHDKGRLDKSEVTRLKQYEIPKGLQTHTSLTRKWRTEPLVARVSWGELDIKSEKDAKVISPKLSEVLGQIIDRWFKKVRKKTGSSYLWMMPQLIHALKQLLLYHPHISV